MGVPTIMPLTLPQIVVAVREQRPNLVPSWIHHDAGDDEYPPCWWIASDSYTAWHELDEEGEVPTMPISEAQVIPHVEAALWRVLHESRVFGRCYWHDGEWCAYNENASPHRFGSDDLALCRALCHAIGVRLEYADA